MEQRIIILDFGSQYTQLIARRIRELNIYSEIIPFYQTLILDADVKGVILSGSPCSISDSNAPDVAFDIFNLPVPVLGICYGAQLMAQKMGGEVTPSKHREYGRAKLKIKDGQKLFSSFKADSNVWMSHGDTIVHLPEMATIIAKTDSIENAAFQIKNKEVYGIQFHPEVTHTDEGKRLLKNFAVNICHCDQSWTPAHFIRTTEESIRLQAGNGQVIMGLSGGVDSTVAATLIDRAVGDSLHCIFINNGLLRKNEFDQVLDDYRHLGLNIKGVDASHHFLGQLKGVKDPEKKRKIIGRVFIEEFDRQAKTIADAKWLGQGTIYPDVIESVSVNGPSQTIKSHHNVGGLPEKMHMGLIEPLKYLFKDEVRKIGTELGLSPDLLGRHPFPGPGLAIRIIDDITPEKLRILQEADHIFISELKTHNLYHKVWQAGAIFLPLQSVGVMGDERTYENAVCLRAVTSVDGMTADWAHLPHDFLATVSNKIINGIKGINRVVYDISSKPPSTIEWE
jgi:GMP synthase (glutamine-hydrolysing)